MSVQVISYTASAKLGKFEVPKNSCFVEENPNGSISVAFLNGKTITTEDWENYLDQDGDPFDSEEDFRAYLRIALFSSTASSASSATSGGTNPIGGV